MRTVVVIVAAALGLSACGRRGDVASGLDIQLVASGWRAAERASGKNKLVPSASVKVTNVSGRTLPSVQVNAVFRRVGEGREWGSAFVTAAGSSGLAPGGGATLTLNSERGYTGEDPEDAMLRNREFVDVTVDVFAKYGSQQWARVGGFSIDRQLLR